MQDFFVSNKYKVLFSLLIIFVLVALFSKEQDQVGTQEIKQEKKPVEVSIVRAGDQKNNSNTLRFPGTIVGDQEIQIISQASGIIKSVNFDLGERVSSGKVLITIDDQSGNFLSQGDNSFASAQVQHLELAVKQAKKSYSLAKDNYEKNKSQATKIARDIAKLQFESAQIELDNSLNSRTIVSNISGIVTERKVSVGDSVAPGQILATISKDNRSKVEFYLSAEEIKRLPLGAVVKIIKGETEIPAIVTNVSPQADNLTKKFLAQASIESGKLLLGEVVEVWLKTENSNLNENNLYLPLSAINNTQTGNYIFIAENESAKKMPISIYQINGEIAVIKSEITDDTKIIVDGNKLINDGDKIKIK